MKKPASKIIGVGHYVPPRVVTNDELASVYGIDTSDEWIQQRSGIKQRHFVDKGVGTSDLGFEASKRAIANAGIDTKDIDGIIFATLSPDHEFPGAGCFLQAKLGLAGCAALDVRTQCTGFIYALSVANALIATGQHKKILVVGAEVHSTGLDLTTRGRDVAVLFGDGAGAVVVAATDGKEDRGILSTVLRADGNFAKELWLEAPGSIYHPRIDSNAIEEGRIYPRMNGKHVFINAVKRMPEVMIEGLSAAGMGVEDMDLLVPHQANIRINEAVGKALGLPDHKVFNTIQNFGNTTAATIPIGLSVALEQDKIKPGMIVGLAAFGSGFTWASAVVRW